MTSVNVTTTKNTVTVNGETRVVTVKTRGPQGPSLPDGDKGDVTVSSNGTAISINNSAVTSAKIADGAIVDADINASAAIALTKLATGALPTAITVTSANISDLSIVDADISASAAISLSKLATGALPTAITVTSANISDLSIVNADINASAAIAGTKISPDFGSQNIVTTGTAATGALGVTGNLTVSGTVDGVDVATRDALFGGLTSSSGVLSNGVTATTQSASDNSTKVATTAYTDTAISNLINGAPAALDTLNELAAALNDDAAFSTTVTNSIATKMPLAGGQFTGNVTFSGTQTVDGRDLSVDGAKLDGIESGATADQTKSDIDALGIAASTATTLATARTIAGVSFDGSADISLNNNAITNGAGYITATLTNEQVQDIVGGMLTGNTETGITVTYQDGDGTIDFAVNQDTTGNAATATALETARTIAGTSFDGSANIDISYTNLTNKLSVGDGGLTQNNFTDALKTKLDGVETGATADQTASEIVALIADQTIAPSTIDMEDNEKIKLGTGDDLEIYHDPSSGSGLNYIKAVSGYMMIQQQGNGSSITVAATNVYLKNHNNNETFLYGVNNGSVDLYYDNSKKLETTSTGVKITGTGTNTVEINGTGGHELYSYHDSGGVGWATGASTNYGELLYLNESGSKIHLYAGGVERLKVDSSGASVTGNIAVSGTVDGVDIATRDTLFGGLTSSSGVLTNGVTATTQSASDNSTKVATTAYADTAISNLVNSAPSTLDTLNELAAALGDDPNFATTVTNSIATKLPLAGGQITGNITCSGSQTFDGRDLSVDGTKLDGIESNATADQTASEIVALVADQTIAPSTIDMEDNEKILLGTGDDLQIYHDGSNSLIVDNGTGGLILGVAGTGTSGFYKGTGQEPLATFEPDGPVSLYYNNSKKLETTAIGVTISGDLKLPDNENVRLGDSNDLILYHNGTNSLIENATGELRIKSSDQVLLQKYGTGESMVRAVPDNTVELYYDNSKKFETNTYGALVSGSLFTTAHVYFGNQTSDNCKAFFGAGNDLVIYHDGTNSHVQNGTGTLRIRGDSIKLNNNAASENYLVATANGAVELYYDNSKKLETTSTGVSVTGKLSIVETTSTNSAHIKMGTSTNQNVHLELENDGSADIRFGCFGSGASTWGNITANDGFIHTTNDLCINATSDTGNISIGTGATPSTKLFVKSDGSIGIGTTSPSAKLDVNGDATINSITVGKGANSVANNTVLGANALDAAVTGNHNTAIGKTALTTNTSGANNTAVGANSLVLNTTASNNTGLGFQALQDNSTGASNTSVGANSLGNNTTGNYNTGVGVDSLKANTTASNNTAVGYDALTLNTTGTENLAVGSNALASNTTSSYSTAVGYKAAQFSTGGYNLALGNEALKGVSGQTTGINNTALGMVSLRDLTTGSNNTATGIGSLRDNTTGSNNVAMGNDALANNETASNNTGLGYNALKANTTGSHNTAVGRNALSATTTALYNVAVGSNALDANTTASYNIAIGYNSLTNNTTGEQNTAIGAETLDSNTEGDNNVGVGLQALYDNTTGGNNTAIGKRALFANTTASNNTALGSEALKANTTGTQNVAVGANALDANTTANNNTAVGYDSLGANTTGYDNVAVGLNSLLVNTTGYDNTAIGSESLDANTTGIQNTAVGRSALGVNTTGNHNAACGAFALDANTTGADNTAMGYAALTTNTTADKNVGVGYFALRYNTAANNTAIGWNSLGANTTGVDNTAVGAQALDSNTTGTDNTALGREALSTSTTGAQNTGIGRSSLKNLTTGSFNTGIGYHSLFSQTTGAHNCGLGRTTLNLNTSGGYNTAVGNAALASNTTASNNVAVGYQALTGNTTGTENVAVGANALDSSTTAGYNTAVGYGAMKDCTTGSINVAIGREAMENLTTGAKNVGVGRGALAGTLTGDENVGVGDSAGAAMTSGVSNVAIGAEALKANTTGANNTAVGKSALQVNTTGANNVAVGAYSLDALTTADKNTALGYQSLTANTTGANNTALGALALDANTTASNSVAIGYLALTENTTGTQNIAIGVETMDANTTGSFNVAVGKAALGANTTADYNVAIGQNCLAANTTGTQNVALGSFALDANTTGHSNVGVGKDAGSSVTTGIQNTLIGTDAGAEITAGYYNTCVGNNSGQDITNGYHNVAIGHSTDTNNVDRSITIGTDLTSKGSDYITFGRDSVGVVYNQYNQNASWTRDSDERLKKDINTNTDCGLEFINDLRTVTYKWKAPSEIDSSMPNYDKDNSTPSYDKKMYGFIAQEVKAALDKHNITDFGGWTCPDDGIQGISYEMFVMPLVKAVQELSAKVTALEAG